MNLKFNKELLKVIGKGTMKYGGLVVIEGIKSVAGQSALKMFNTAIDDGLGAVKDLKFDEIVGIKDKKSKKKLFSRKDKKDRVEKTLEEVVEAADTDAKAVKIDDADMEVVDSK